LLELDELDDVLDVVRPLEELDELLELVAGPEPSPLQAFKIIHSSRAYADFIVLFDKLMMRPSLANFILN
jgi:hypothetical protein